MKQPGLSDLSVTGPVSALLMLAVWLGASQLSGVFIVPPMNTSLLWLPAGLSLSVLIQTPRRLWGWPVAVVLAGQLFGGVLLNGRSVGHSLGWGLAAVATVVPAALLLRAIGRRRARRQPDFESISGAPVLLAASLFGGLLGALAAGATLQLEQVPVERMWLQMATWWAGDALAMFLVTPLLVAPGRALSGPVDRWLARVALGVVVIIVALALEADSGLLLLAFIPSLAVPAQIVLAMKGGPRGAACVAPLLILLAGVPAVLGESRLEVQASSPLERLLVLQSFLAMSHLAALLFAAVLAQRERATLRNALLVEVGDALGASLVAERVLQTAVDRLVPALADEVVVWHADGDGEKTVRARGGVAGLLEAMGVRPGEVAAQARLDEPGRHACLTPLYGRDSRLGLMGFAWTGRVPHERDRVLAQAVASRVAVALENSRLFAQATAAVAAREEFISIAAHELRTPLTSLQLRLQSILREGGFDARVGERIGRAQEQTARLSRLIDLLLDVSRVHLGSLDLRRQPVRLAVLAQDVVERFAEQARQAGSPLTLEVRADPTSEVDRLRVEQVLTNLLSNALKFGRGRPVTVVVDQVDGAARLEVRDQGRGVDPATRDRLFDRFWRGVSAEHFGGLGLGLYLARYIVEAHGGHVAVLDTVGRGATFAVTLPLAAQEAVARVP